MNFIKVTTFLSGVVGKDEFLGGEGSVAIEQITNTTTELIPQVQQQASSNTGMLYFLMIRPQKKREKEVKETQALIKAGDSIVTSSGLFGKVTSVGGDCFLVEFGTNKSVIIPIRKSDVIEIRTPKISIAQEK
jgi:preprotein translocase YajC subunit